MTSVNKTGIGAYTITFAQNVSACAYVANYGNTNTTAPSRGAFVAVSGDPGSTSNVLVRTFFYDGTNPEDNPFHLAVLC